MDWDIRLLSHVCLKRGGSKGGELSWTKWTQIVWPEMPTLWRSRKSLEAVENELNTQPWDRAGVQQINIYSQILTGKQVNYHILSSIASVTFLSTYSHQFLPSDDFGICQNPTNRCKQDTPSIQTGLSEKQRLTTRILFTMKRNWLQQAAARNQRTHIITAY